MPYLSPVLSSERSQVTLFPCASFFYLNKVKARRKEGKTRKICPVTHNTGQCVKSNREIRTEWEESKLGIT
jgi:hypothetical protein